MSLIKMSCVLTKRGISKHLLTKAQRRVSCFQPPKSSDTVELGHLKLRMKIRSLLDMVKFD